uniref:GDP-fucose protein O-fucosyltransferase 2 n=1 Tax=Rhizophora mucronata TaxID=61149 RepID=A0A2P2LYD1_RHIMU
MDRRRDSLEEEEDREKLLPQNHLQQQRQHQERNHHNHPSPQQPQQQQSHSSTSSSPRSSPAAFHIDEDGDLDLDLNSTPRRRLSRGQRPGTTANVLKFFKFNNPNNNNNHNKTYIMLAIFLPLFFVLLFFSTDIRSLFSSATILSLPPSPSSDRMLQSELRALYLLRQQQLSLFSLWNHSNSKSSSNTNSSNDDNYFNNPLYQDFFKSVLLKQISLNKEIQQLLLSSHQSKDKLGNANATSDYFQADSSLSCAKVDQRRSHRRTIDWNPRSDKFLFAICLSGQMSNHLICLEKHMFFAALLNRVLVIPSSKFDYQYGRVLDVQHINDCLGKKAVVTFEELLESKKSHVHIDRFFCYFSSPTPCYVDDDHVKKLKASGISMGKLESPWKEDIRNPTKRTVKDVESRFKSDDDVIAIGDVFYADVEKDWLLQPGGPLAHKCKTLIEPSKLVLLTAQRFIQTFLGKNFIAVHFRRHGFLKFCNAKKPSCFYPIPQAADCITRVVERAYTPLIYLSTDAAESETALLQSLIVLNGKTVPLVTRPPHNSAEKWDALLHRHGLNDDPQVEAMLDKTICAMSTVFIGASGSTFTEDILRLRKDWDSASVCDEYLCQGELPNFLADDE